ncbi:MULTISPECIES: helix-turn-helix domain-containing protein [unclassified Streptomyces]|uniref:helix-turn-helix domain-containing protein n=1 Tax=unclassified Streptomyces TaxID=2593676 RepID=UPI001BE85A21|nr:MULTISPECIES: helix-turn-helix domain-containing protein [unclassified Streptomyces]MBT2403629.1 helix-turn-helix domain-containing protein [Streptomyces sp. ISL-21]MBT2609832.1 helix-turn-helix domain-containing protein [Streptomyces sp. ISL-87]
MADQQLSAPSRASSGIRHINHDHHRRGYVEIGNHLAQHRELSMTAIGLATHIQSLPTGAKVTIKALAERFPEGEVRIAAALRELEKHRYLARTQERLPTGRVVTSTVSYNNPPAMSAEAARERRVPPTGSGSGPGSAPEPGPQPGHDPDPEPEAEPEPEPAPAPAVVPEVELQARELLARLRLHDPRLVLSERDTVRLAPAAAVWLERGLPPSAVTAALTRLLPVVPIHSPAGSPSRPPGPARPGTHRRAVSATGRRSSR